MERRWRASWARTGGCGNKFAMIRKLLKQGKSQEYIAKKVSCGQSTVSRERCKLKERSGGEDAA
jgi:hypothetical protein